MSHCTSHAVTLTSDGSGDGTARTAKNVNGRVVQIFYEPGTLDTGTDLVITGNTSGAPICTLTNAGTSDIAFTPRQATRDIAGAASLYAAAGEPVEAAIWISDERIKIVVDEGAATKTGTITFWIG